MRLLRRLMVAAQCAAGLHGSGLIGNRTPGPRAARECLRCRRAWIGAYDGIEAHWQRVR